MRNTSNEGSRAPERYSKRAKFVIEGDDDTLEPVRGGKYRGIRCGAQRDLGDVNDVPTRSA
jgi:hypothetical protein